MKARLITKCGCTRTLEVDPDREVIKLAFLRDEDALIRPLFHKDWDKPIQVMERTFRRDRKEDVTAPRMKQTGDYWSPVLEVVEAVFREVSS